jgi:hypothetical protein
MKAIKFIVAAVFMACIYVVFLFIRAIESLNPFKRS